MESEKFREYIQLKEAGKNPFELCRIGLSNRLSVWQCSRMLAHVFDITISQGKGVVLFIKGDVSSPEELLEPSKSYIQYLLSKHTLTSS